MQAARKGYDMKRLLPYLREYRKESILAPLFKLLEAIFDLLVPLAVARMIDGGDNRKTVIIYFCVLIAMAVIGLTCTVVAQYFSARASVGFAGRLRCALFSRIQKFSYSDIDAEGSDTLITRLSGDINQVQNGLNMGLRLLLRSPFIVLGCTVMAFTINVRCALIFALTVPVLFAITFLIMKASIPLFGKAQSGLDRVTRMTRENLTGARVIRAFCREESEIEEFDEGNRALTSLNLFVGRLSALLNPVTYVLINLATVFLIREAAVRVELGSLAQGEVVALYNYMLQIIVELIKLASLIITLNRSLACAGRVADVMAIEPSMTYAPDGIGSFTDGSVTFDNVSFTYRGAGAPSLDGISFSAPSGSTVGIIGGTGSGKTTLINLIPRFYDATTGNITVGGQDVRGYSRAALADAVGVVPQKAMLFSGTIRDNLKFGDKNATDERLWAALETAQAREIVEGKPGGLDSIVEQNGRNFSGGQRQRLTIARALVKKPQILILDDSSSALDYATDAALRRSLRAQKGATTFIVSQRIACVRDADMILVLDNGRLVGRGTHEQLLDGCGVYRDIYCSQFPEEKESTAQRGIGKNGKTAAARNPSSDSEKNTNDTPDEKEVRKA